MENTATTSRRYKELNCDQWEVDETCEYLKDEGHEKWVDEFRERKLTGKWLQFLTLDHLEEMGIQNRDDRLKVQHSIRKLWELTEQGKVFNDPIHGHMELHPLLVKIIDTPQFQRLRNIKQLGGAYFVYPGASHNRFEHSIGVGHLAGELVKGLHARQPKLNITATDILCVQIAGLFHDLGHGPFSHLYDQMFIPRARPGKQWKHENASLQMFDQLVKRDDVQQEMRKYGLKLPRDQTFIKEMIAGPKRQEQLHTETAKKWPYQGRPQEKSFLYEIVANKRNGIDVDKFDYLSRDCYHLGIRNNFDHLRFLKFARVCKVDGEDQICTRDKEVINMYDLFHTRNGLHRRACQHRVHSIIENMIAEAFVKADKHIQIEGSGGKMFTLSTAIDDIEAYTKLTDRVFEQILNSYSPTMAEARQILNKTIFDNLSVIVTAIKSEESSKPTKKEQDQGGDSGPEASKDDHAGSSQIKEGPEETRQVSGQGPGSSTTSQPKASQEQIKRWREELAKLDAEEVVIKKMLNSYSEDLTKSRQELREIISEKLPHLLREENSEKFTQEQIDHWREELIVAKKKDAEEVVIEKMLNSYSEDLTESRQELHEIICEKLPHFLREENSEKFTQEQIDRWRKELIAVNKKDGSFYSTKKVVIQELLNSSSEKLTESRRELREIISEKLSNLKREKNSEKPTQEQIDHWRKELIAVNKKDGSFYSAEEVVIQELLNSSSEKLTESRQELYKNISEKLSNLKREKNSEKPTQEQINRWRVELAKLDGSFYSTKKVVIQELLNSSSEKLTESRRELHEIISEKLSNLKREKNSEKPTQEQINRWREELAKLDDEEDVIEKMLNSYSEDLTESRRELHKIISEKLPHLLREENSEKFTQEIKRWREELGLENERDERAVVEKILNSSYPQLAEACWILHKIISRKHYRFLGEIQDPNQTKILEAKTPNWKEELTGALEGDGLNPEDFVVLDSTMDYGRKDKDPIEKVYFYSKRDPDRAFHIPRGQVSSLLPTCFSEKLIRFYCKKTDEESLEGARDRFRKWCEDRGLSVQQGEGQEPPVQNPGGEQDLADGAKANIP